MAIQNPEDIISALTTLGTSLDTVLPQATPSIPSLDFQVPTNLDEKLKEFLVRVSQDPDIVNYYQQLLTQAQNDTDLAKSYLERDYKTGVRYTTDKLSNRLAQLGLTFTDEQQAKLADLNKRGIALTDIGGGKTAYAAGGQAATELGQLNESQRLRQEAEQRSAQQNIEKLGLSREKGMTSAGQGLYQEAMNLTDQKRADIYSRGAQNYNVWQGQQSMEAQKKFYDQQARMSGGGDSGGGDTELDQLRKIGISGGRNPVQETRYQQLLKGG